MRKISEEAYRLMRDGATVTDATRAMRRSNLSSRSRVLREATNRGIWFAVVALAPPRMRVAREDAHLLAAESANGADSYGHCAVPDRWRPLFKRAFVKSLLCHLRALDLGQTVTAYGVP